MREAESQPRVNGTDVSDFSHFGLLQPQREAAIFPLFTTLSPGGVGSISAHYLEDYNLQVAHRIEPEPPQKTGTAGEREQQGALSENLELSSKAEMIFKWLEWEG